MKAQEPLFRYNMTKEQIVVDDYKFYKEKPYNNSNGDWFGVSLNGRAKDCIQAHNKFRDMIKKGKVYEVEYRTGGKIKKGKIKCLSVIATKTITDTTIEVTTQEALRGNVQLKSYIPSNSKKKGASTELRKLSDYEYSHVEVLKEIVTNLLDRIIAGDTVDHVVNGP